MVFSDCQGSLLSSAVLRSIIQSIWVNSKTKMNYIVTDYVFGVPLARNYPNIHRNVDMSYYNHSIDEEHFSRQLIRYWSNFIKTGFVYIFISSFCLL